MLIIALAIGVLLQWDVLLTGGTLFPGGKAFPGVHFYREARFNVALIFDGLVILRMLVAAVLKECNRNWIVYALLCVASPWGIIRLSSFIRIHYGV